MKRILLVALGLCLTVNAMAWVKCDDIVNKYGVYTQTCQNMPGPEPASNYYHGSTVSKGDIKKITKSSDGSISVERYGHEGEREEYRETSPGTWERR